MSTTYQQLFSAFIDARLALSALSSRGEASDQTLAQDPDYRRLHHCGMVIARIGGGPAIVAAIDALSKDEAGSASLRRYWAGMDLWPEVTEASVPQARPTAQSPIEYRRMM
ncbi:hypothetical protein Q9295_02490 [Xinfangfangia sp. CPCC 101601]|uniref:Uncharacterized protein n=1 Tax=Pseudogemmobacter lacusdianii TaxID=3069608 RepID=A0ABU0VU28_9RHOB|nr:hypothetical protein [Xinfangfangia sp. CPCC 101601]MDQ2065229.1 hypothetical protein [Xinfangfangia sp. CPCC 101601]